MKWRLGIDLGTNSLGWWALELHDINIEVTGIKTGQPFKSLDGGVIIFPDGREPSSRGRVGDSRAVNRRMARGARKIRDRRARRFKRLTNKLIELNLLPSSDAERRLIFQNTQGASCTAHPYDPYKLRSEGLERELSPYELGRALAHLGRRRGFKSNRKDQSDEDGGKLKERIERLKETLNGETLGQHMWAKYQAQLAATTAQKKPHGIRFRADQDFYPAREMYEDEFDRIRAQQEPFHPALTDDDWQELKDTVLWQNPLKPVERGFCEFFHSEHRHWTDTPIAHDFRIYQEVNNLRLIDGDGVVSGLEEEQRQAIIDKLYSGAKTVSFGGMRKLKGADGKKLFPANSRFNLEGVKRKDLKAHRWAGLFAEDPDLGPLWQARQEQEDPRLDDAFVILHEAEEDKDAVEDLTQHGGFSDAAIRKLVSLTLSAGTSSVSLAFMRQIKPYLRMGHTFDEAVGKLEDADGNKLHHSMRDDGTRWERLPYYGEVLRGSVMGGNPEIDKDQFPEKHYGRINNPTVHVALNQLQKLVNRLTERFGSAPAEIHIELARELKLPKKAREEAERQQAKNQKRNEDIRNKFDQLVLSPNDIKKVKLWEELGKDELTRCCPFSGEPIRREDLFTSDVEIEHILPFSRTLDNSMANLTLAKTRANRLKRNETPFKAFAADQYEAQGIIWSEIQQRIAKLPDNKKWRFASDAMERFERDNNFLARQLTDTAYMARVARRYLQGLKGVRSPIVSNPGRLTAALRGLWGLNGLLSDDNQKTRSDHRHHAIDAFVVALVDRRILQEVSTKSRKGEDGLWRLRRPDLDPELRQQLRDRVPTIIVAHKPNHGLQGKFFKETAYGLVPDHKRDPDLPDHNLVVRKPLEGLTPKEVTAIRDPHLREAISTATAGITDKTKRQKALADFGKAQGIKRVRLLIKDQTAYAIPSAPYKAYLADAIAFCDIWRVPKGKPGKWIKGEYDWKGVFWSYLELSADQGPPDPASKPPAGYETNAKFMMRVFKNDLIEVRQGDVWECFVVAGFSTTDNRLDITPHHVAEAKRTYVSINVLGAKGLRRLKLYPDGSKLRPDLP